MRIRDPGWKKFGSGIQYGKNSDPGWKKFRSGIFIPDPQRCLLGNIHKYMRMRSILVVRASDCQCTSCNGPGFDPSIRHSGIWGAADEVVLNIVLKKIPQQNIYRKKTICGTTVGCVGLPQVGDGRQERWDAVSDCGAHALQLGGLHACLRPHRNQQG